MQRMDGGQTEEWRDWGRKVVKKTYSMKQRVREKYGTLEREGERNCSFQGLAAFQAVWL